MSTSSAVFDGSKRLLAKTVLYLLGSVLTTAVCFVFLTLISAPAIVGGLLTTNSMLVLHLALLGIAGLSFYFGQLVLREDTPDRDEMEVDVSWSEILAISVGYYSLLNIMTVSLGMFLFVQGYPQIGLFAILLYGPLDIEMAQKVNASPITIIVAATYALGYAFGIVTSAAGDSLEPRQVATLSLERFKRRRKRIGGI
jgi:hypothetical protein